VLLAPLEGRVIFYLLLRLVGLAVAVDRLLQVELEVVVVEPAVVTAVLEALTMGMVLVAAELVDTVAMAEQAAVAILNQVLLELVVAVAVAVLVAAME
jgi:hypothetical protein